jgi:hypothetical protein
MHRRPNATVFMKVSTKSLMSRLSRAANLFRSSGVDRPLDEEITFHIESRIDDLVAAGMSREAAEAMARRQFGSRLRRARRPVTSS